MEEQENRQSVTIENVVIYKDELDQPLAKDIFDKIVERTLQQWALNVSLLCVQFELAGCANTLVGLMNNTPVKGAIDPDVDIEETAAFPSEDTP